MNRIMMPLCVGLFVFTCAGLKMAGAQSTTNPSGAEQSNATIRRTISHQPVLAGTTGPLLTSKDAPAPTWQTAPSGHPSSAIIAVRDSGTHPGYTHTETPLALCDVWTIKASMAVARHAPVAASPGNGKIYVIGGWNGAYLSTCEEYDPSTDTWTTKASMSESRAYFAAAAPGNGKLYAIGGLGRIIFASCEEFDPATNTWTTKAPMPSARNCHAAAAPGNGKLYVFGGTASIPPYPPSSPGALATCVEYDPSTDTWTTKAPMGVARYLYASATACNGKVYAIGGLNNSYSPAYLTTCEEYDPSNNTWTTKAPMGTPREWAAAAAPGNGKIYVAGGSNTQILATCEEYSNATNTWKTVTPMKAPRWDLAAAGPANGKFYAVGGWAGSSPFGNGTPLATCEEYTPAPGSVQITAAAAIPFGVAICERYLVDSITVSNNGCLPLTITSDTISGPDSSDFMLLVPMAGLSIAAGSSAVVPIRFIGSANGKRTATLTIHSNADPDSVITIALSASRDSAALSTSLSNIDLGLLYANTSKDTFFTVMNTGTVANLLRIASPLEITATPILATLDSGMSTLVHLHFAGRPSDGVIDDTLLVTDSVCSRTRIVHITGRVSTASVAISQQSPDALAGRDLFISRIVPNPTRSSVTLTFNVSQNYRNDGVIEVFDELGSVLQRVPLAFPAYHTSMQVRLVLDGPPGSYYLRVSTSSGVQTKRVLVNR